MDGGEAARRMLVGSNCGTAIINPIMMRFRPIAPKPVAGCSVSGDTSSVESKNNSSISEGRTKRKYVRVRKYNRKKKTTRSNTTSEPIVDQPVVDQASVTTTTLQLLPERHVEFVGSGSQWWEGNERDVERRESELALVSDSKRGAVEVWVTVECATEACMDVELGSTDEERIKNLEEDTCPGFVSEGVKRVEWVNKAFKRMVRQRQGRSEGEAGGEIEVRLITKPRLRYLGRVFTCQIKLQFKAKEGTEMVVPCDAWRMDGGGIAWKLDVKAALTLAPLLQEEFE